MDEEKNIVRELKSRHSLYCIWGKCKDCSREVDGRGIHDVEVYQLFKCTEDEECGNCGGEGTTRHECWECGGSGEVEERCEDCKGEGRIPDKLGDRKLIKEVSLLSSHD